MQRIAIIVSMLFLPACGFKPIYATPDGAAAPVNMQIAVGPVSAPEEVHLFVDDALRERIVLREGQTPKYELTVSASENAQRLAVQIDATVTRYNYRLGGRYVLVNLETGEAIRGRASAVTSYNIVSSQYSTLFAERSAREKAARQLAEEIERDIILRLNDPTAAPAIEDDEDFIDPITADDIIDPRDAFDDDDAPFLIEQNEE